MSQLPFAKLKSEIFQIYLIKLVVLSWMQDGHMCGILLPISYCLTGVSKTRGVKVLIRVGVYRKHLGGL
jgi:hypothetical protein